MTGEFDYLSVADIWELTGRTIPKKTLYDLITAGEIPHKRFGRRIRVRRPVIEAWLLAQEGDQRRLPTSDTVRSIGDARMGAGSRSSR